jgi:predicted nucleotidyltransferase
MIESYASYFVSYLLFNIKNKEMIKKIILFGSVAKGESNKNSDVDIFIEVNKKLRSLELEMNNLVNSFYKSRESLIFKNKGIDNKINLIVGKLDEWENLKKSIESTGIVLYGNFENSGKGNKKYSLFFWDKIGKNRGAFLNKMYGFKSNNKKYSGLIEIFHGKKIGKSCVLVPVEFRENIISVLKHYKVNAKILEIYWD